MQDHKIARFFGKRAVVVLTAVCLLTGFAGCSDKTSSEPMHTTLKTTLPITEAETVIGEYAGIRKKFSGTWNRTGVQKALAAEVEITEQAADSFQFSITASYGDTSDTLKGKAVFQSEDQARFQQASGGSITFLMAGDRLKIETKGMGASLKSGVTLEGSYLKGDPLYTNDDILRDMLTDKQQTSLKEKLGESAYRNYVRIYEEGVAASGDSPFRPYEGNVSGALYESSIPGTASRARTLISSKGSYYVKIDGDSKVYTDDSQNRIPDCFKEQTETAADSSGV